ncbi:hypothetical protein AB0N07_31425 [Streptomyces sp. NPDC051172]|uniref:hypothetical protein n=1 Tax=Streptomyces sp. NPDC051172 TaxID=3155796 RepID=UPI003422E00E
MRATPRSFATLVIVCRGSSRSSRARASCLSDSFRGCREPQLIPSKDYRQNKVKPDHAATFDRLVGAADTVLVLDNETANRAAYEGANRAMLQRAERLVAVWNGEPPSGRGGTADTVLEARDAGLPVDVVWPQDAARTN